MKKEKSKNLIVVAASSNYLPGINALFNSIDYHKIDADVLLLSFRLPEDYLSKIQEVFDFNINIVRSEGGDQVKILLLKDSDWHQIMGRIMRRFVYWMRICTLCQVNLIYSLM